MTLRSAWCVAALIAPMAISPATAFTPTTRALIVQRALSLMPPALARQLEKHHDALHAGAQEGLADEGVRRQALDPGDADRQLVRAVERAIKQLEKHGTMEEFARALGRVAQLGTDLSFALNVGPDDPREAEFFDDYARFVESKSAKFALTFGGYADPNLAQDDVAGFARRLGERARRDYDGIVRSYFPAGRERRAGDFDERSVAFACASLETSLAITSVAQLWLYVWYRCGGDLTGTPFLDSRLTSPSPSMTITRARSSR